MISPGDIAALIRRRQFIAALERLERLPLPSAPEERAEYHSWRRQCLARLGRWQEAARAGQAAISGHTERAEDHFRLAQILLRADGPAEALEAGLTALRLDPGITLSRLVPLVEAVLRRPDLEDRLLDSLRELVGADDGTDSLPAKGDILFPFMPSFGGRCDHPSITGLLSRTRLVDIVSDAGNARQTARALPLLLPPARSMVETFRKVHPTVDIASAAAFVATRLRAGDGVMQDFALDFLSPYPTTLASRPFVLCHDYLPLLFQPLCLFDETRVDQQSPFYWMVKSLLESNYCLGIFSHLPTSGGHLAAFFESAAIAKKIVHVNPHHHNTPFPAETSRNEAGPLTVLFTTSRVAADETFLYRGGVDALNAIVDLAEEGENIRLIVRAPAPGILADRLKRLLAGHPAIEWRPEPMSDEDFAELRRRSHIYLMCGGVLYRNGLTEAIEAGLVPVVSDILGIEDFVTHGVNGIVVPGRGELVRLTASPPRLEQDLRVLLGAVDRPAQLGFYDALKAALRKLGRDRSCLVRMGATNRSSTPAVLYSPRDIQVFDQALARWLDEARAMRARGELAQLPRYAAIC